MDDILFIVLSSLLSMAAYWNAGRASRLIVGILGGPSQEYVSAKRALAAKRKELDGVSAKDEFARWARLQRSIGSDDRGLSVQERQLSAKSLALGVSMRLVFFACYAVCSFIVVRRIASMTWVVREPLFFLPITPLIFLFICHMALLRLFSLC